MKLTPASTAACSAAIDVSSSTLPQKPPMAHAPKLIGDTTMSVRPSRRPEPCTMRPEPLAKRARINTLSREIGQAGRRLGQILAIREPEPRPRRLGRAYLDAALGDELVHDFGQEKLRVRVGAMLREKGTELLAKKTKYGWRKHPEIHGNELAAIERHAGVPAGRGVHTVLPLDPHDLLEARDFAVFGLAPAALHGAVGRERAVESHGDDGGGTLSSRYIARARAFFIRAAAIEIVGVHDRKRRGDEIANRQHRLSRAPRLLPPGRTETRRHVFPALDNHVRLQPHRAPRNQALEVLFNQAIDDEDDAIEARALRIEHRVLEQPFSVRPHGRRLLRSAKPRTRTGGHYY